MDLQDKRWATAIQKAMRSGVVPREMYRVYRHGILKATVYTVPSATNPELTSYEVTIFQNGNLSCTCPAATHGVPCWHAALVWLWEHGLIDGGAIWRNSNSNNSNSGQ